MTPVEKYPIFDFRENLRKSSSLKRRRNEMRLRTTVYYFLWFAVLTILILYFAGGCGKTEQPVPPAAPAAEQPKQEAPAARTTDGKKIYQKHCAVCHGKEGKGDGIPGARNFTNKTEWKTYGEDEKTYKVIAEGGTAVLGPMSGMPPFGGVLSKEEIKTVTNYVKSLAK